MAAYCTCCGAEITPKSGACTACGAPYHGGTPAKPASTSPNSSTKNILPKTGLY